MSKRLNHLIILAHPSGGSFSHQVAQALVAQGEENNWDVTLRDLYETQFDPVLSADDLSMLYRGKTPADILEEQKLVSAADMVTFIYPMWWTGFPAIMKGYIDRVFSYGYAYKSINGAIEGLLKGKKVYIYTSMGNDIARYDEANLTEAFKKIHSDEIFGFCGMEVVDHQYFEKITSASKQQIEKYIDDILKQYPAALSISSTCCNCK